MFTVYCKLFREYPDKKVSGRVVIAPSTFIGLDGKIAPGKTFPCRICKGCEYI